MTERNIRTVAIVGAGAMGAMYAQHFASGGLDTWLVARGERAERLRTAALTVNGDPLRAEVVDTGTDSGGRTADLVLIAVKHHQLADAVAEVAPLVGEQTTFLSVLNGLDSEEVIAAAYGADRVLLAIALAMDAQRDGTAIRYRQPGRLALGVGPGMGTTERLAAVQEALDRAGLAWVAPADMPHEMWWKFMVNVGINQASAVLRAPYGAFQHDGPARSLMLALMAEVIAVAEPEGVELGEADLAAWDRVLAGQPAQGQTSMYQDVLAGRPTEVDIFAGRVVALGARHGVPTPYNQTMQWILGSSAQ
ncbi:ketopantoate reductase family protein [Raineyella fluvialis]|uniref:2-dehydropantoate 2-reductase n=1 Tax=Raineyella fluvialis TaxID=2662261 RepID=A0A5Q2FD10_9ACTN|nr:ketopantoate reductase family protein [Raineyella fluvialis]QGF24689.1 2-dehydropantoate 2-reductase [Raineyella fluvialis]